jgi:hypothetical protein
MRIIPVTCNPRRRKDLDERLNCGNDNVDCDFLAKLDTILELVLFSSLLFSIMHMVWRLLFQAFTNLCFITVLGFVSYI